MIATAIWALTNPQIAPPAYTSTTWKEKFTALWGFLPSGIMIVSVLGGIYGGIVTPTEAAALGALVAGVLCIIKGRMKVGMLKKCLLSTIVVSSMSYMILAGSSLINFTFNYLRVPEQLSAWVVSMSLTPGMVFFLAVIMYLILGCFIDGISMVVLTVPTVFPLMISLGYDPIWFGVQLVLLVEIALVTPPVGVNLYVLAGIAKNSSFGEICQGVLPYIGCLMIAIVLMFIYPQICLWLPGTM
jgi:tripartite ATP-independent transporter DctM subunit